MFFNFIARKLGKGGVRHACAALGIAAAVGAVVFTDSLTASGDHQALAMAERLLTEVRVPEGAQVAQMALDYRPGGRVMQGPPMTATVATSDMAGIGPGECVVTPALFAQRRLPVPPEGTELTFVGRKGAYKLKMASQLDWSRPVRGYPNVFVTPTAAEAIGEEWTAFETPSAEELAPLFTSDAGRNMDRAKPLLLWAAALTALCLLLNSLFLSVEARRTELATLRVVGLTRTGVVKLVAKEALALTLAGLVVGIAAALAALWCYVAVDADTFPMGMAVGRRGVVASAALAPLIAVLGALVALKPALSVKPLEAASNRPPRRKHIGMLVAFACGFGAFVAVEVWGTSLTKPFIPSPEWPDAIVSILPGGVSSFDIERLRGIPGVERIAELQPLQVNILPLEEMKGFGGGKAPRGRGGPGGMRGAQYRNALLLASDWLPDFKFSEGSHGEAEKAIREGDACVITEMMARARGLKKGDSLELDAGGGLVMKLEIAGIVDLNWHMVTSRGLLRGMNRMPGNTDGPVFVSFDTLSACDMRPQQYVPMTHLWLDYKPDFLAKNGVFPSGRIVERDIVKALGGAYLETEDGDVRGNTVRLHSRDEVADGTLSHGSDLVGAMARVPFIFLAVVSLGFVAMLVASFDSRRREFVVLRAVGATRMQLASRLVGETLKVAFWGIVLGIPGGALVGWLSTSATRALMANWGLPASFSMPVPLVLEAALGAVLFALLFAVPTALVLVGRARAR